MLPLQRLQRRLAILAGVLLVVVACVHTSSAQVRRPNMVMIVGDDMGYADIGVHGSKDIPTPNIDALAKGGVRFSDAYVTGGPTMPGTTINGATNTPLRG